MNIRRTASLPSRRDFVRRGLYGIGVPAGLPVLLQGTASALAAEALDGNKEAHPERILVVVELTGGNDGLNTVIPFRNDAYYRARPTLGSPGTMRSQSPTKPASTRPWWVSNGYTRTACLPS